ncbi:hypothetical protein GAR06_04103 [Micromonospora saelicesensis]|nr:hypothetical protein GAR06_04103 [Micromonospora saelicesensis]
MRSVGRRAGTGRASRLHRPRRRWPTGWPAMTGVRPGWPGVGPRTSPAARPGNCSPSANRRSRTSARRPARGLPEPVACRSAWEVARPEPEAVRRVPEVSPRPVRAGRPTPGWRPTRAASAGSWPVPDRHRRPRTVASTPRWSRAVRTRRPRTVVPAARWSPPRTRRPRTAAPAARWSASDRTRRPRRAARAMRWWGRDRPRQPRTDGRAGVRRSPRTPPRTDGRRAGHWSASHHPPTTDAQPADHWSVLRGVPGWTRIRPGRVHTPGADRRAPARTGGAPRRARARTAGGVRRPSPVPIRPVLSGQPARRPGGTRAGPTRHPSSGGSSSAPTSRARWPTTPRPGAFRRDGARPRRDASLPAGHPRQRDRVRPRRRTRPGPGCVPRSPRARVRAGPASRVARSDSRRRPAARRSVRGNRAAPRNPTPRCRRAAPGRPAGPRWATRARPSGHGARRPDRRWSVGRGPGRARRHPAPSAVRDVGRAPRAGRWRPRGDPRRSARAGRSPAWCVPRAVRDRGGGRR